MSDCFSNIRRFSYLLGFAHEPEIFARRLGHTNKINERNTNILLPVIYQYPIEFSTFIFSTDFHG
jgi:hypothetical protein